MRCGIRADLSMAWQPLMEAPGAVERKYRNGCGGGKVGKGVPVYVMPPLDSVTMANGVNRRKAMTTCFQALKSAGVEGVMMDVWKFKSEWVRPESLVMLCSLKAAAESYGKPDWGTTGPTDAGEYNNSPEKNQFLQKRIRQLEQ
ncbi:hypothetical protein L1987_00706 [Smallanthus sonchifolius]|uniref:Uncharacterized protein n=1 Tax=Smallanthus sonchifolius TaxID=185202 RepID=A0ACB9K305_9ASTR|nr:hypothetical protein L1987_00706 [Smallanthus sonchifolius]